MKYLKALTLLFLTFIISACNNSRHDLERNAKGYIQAMADYRLDDARRFATPETNQYTIDYILSWIMPILDSSYIEQNTPATIYIDSIVNNNDTSATVYYHKKTPLQTINADVEMRLRDGHWLAHQPINPAPFLGASVGTSDTLDSPLQSDSI